MMTTEPLEHPLVKVHLHGPLAERFGATHDFAIRSPREATAALAANFPGFIPEFLKYQHYYIVADDDIRDGDLAPLLPVSRELHFYPKVEGDDFLISAALVALFPALGVAAANIIGGILLAGVAIGLSFLLRPKQPEKPKEKDPNADTSFAFTGPENTVQQGIAVPLVYGRVFCGSVVISAGLSVSDEDIPT